MCFALKDQGELGNGGILIFCYMQEVLSLSCIFCKYRQIRYGFHYGSLGTMDIYFILIRSHLVTLVAAGQYIL